MINDRLIDAGELPLAVRDFGGSGHPVLLVHGESGNLATMTTLARAMRTRHRVITVDLRGHGRSGDGTWTFDAALGDLAAVAVQLDLDRPAVVGHGIGGMLACLWGARHPESPGVVSLDGVPEPTTAEQLPGLEPQHAKAELARLHAALDAAAQTPDGPIAPDTLADLVERQQMAARDMGANEKVWIEGFRRNLAHAGGQTTLRPSAKTAAEVRTAAVEFDLDGVLAAVRSPLLIVLATRDRPEQEPFAAVYTAYRRGVAERVAAVAQRTPTLAYLSLPDASHAMHIEQPARLATLIGDFLTP